MKSTTSILALCLAAACLLSCGCSRKGSSSVRTRSHTTTTRATPRVRAGNSETDADREARLKAEREAESRARQEAEAAGRAAQKAKEEAERLAEEERKLVVKEERVKMVETKAKDVADDSRFHVIIGSFKVLQNARQLCQDAIAKGFLPSIMENEEGMFRVGILSAATEKTAREKIAQLRSGHPEYVGMWLLIEKK